jgi:outer membrane protein assembly factor BamB
MSGIRRRAVSGTIFALLIVSIFAIPPNIQPARAEPGSAESPWPMFRHDSQRTGRSQYVGPETPLVKWTYTGRVGLFSPVISSDDGTIYARCHGGFLLYLLALNPDASLKWVFSSVMVSSEVYRTSPAIGIDGAIYFGDSNDKKFYALSPAGTVKWYYRTGGGVYSSPAIGVDGTIYFGSGFRDEYFYALNPDGTLKWKYQIRDTMFITSPAIAHDGTIYVFATFLQSILYALSPDGTLNWSYNIPPEGLYGESNHVDESSSPAISSDGTIYFGDLVGKLYALNPNGALKWNYQTEDSIYSSPAVGADGTIYFGSQDKRFYALNPDGSLKWYYQTDGGISSSPAIGVDGTIYFSSSDGYVYALNPDGTLEWEYQTGQIGDPVIGVDATLYMGTFSKLYAFGSKTILPPENKTPTASFTYSPQNPVVGEEVTFDASASVDPDGTIVSYQWSFGDGNSGLGKVATHDYSNTGTFTVTLTVADNEGVTASTVKTVKIEDRLSLPVSNQPQLRAPWKGTAQIAQGNKGATSHYDHGTWDNTYAIDVALPTGSEVLAPADGVVKYVDNDPGGPGGKELAIEHTGPTGEKFVTVYLHLSEILVAEGGVVREGQVVARSGATGEVTGPHLHFHMWRPSGSPPQWAYDSHTMPIERLVLKQIDVDSDFREYDARRGELDDGKIAGKFFESNNVPVSLTTISSTPPPAGRQCVIATAAYGSELDPHVRYLREFRDGLVLHTASGRQFMTAFNQWYYSFSPQLAWVVSQNEGLRMATKAALYPLFGILYASSVVYTSLAFNPELAVVVAGLTASFLIGMAYFCPVAALISLHERRYPKVRLALSEARKWLALAWMATLSLLVASEFTTNEQALMFSTVTLVLTTITLTALHVNSVPSRIKQIARQLSGRAC